MKRQHQILGWLVVTVGVLAVLLALTGLLSAWGMIDLSQPCGNPAR